MMDIDTDSQQIPDEIDPIWLSSRTARQIYALGEVDKDIGRLLSLAASSISLLTLPQTDESDSTLPQGEERSEQFVLEVSEYFERLDQIHINMRSALAQIRQSRVAPSAINAPTTGFIPRSSGMGTPSLSENTIPGGINPAHASGAGSSTGASNTASNSRQQKKWGLQEERINRDAWKGMLDALTRLRAIRERSDQSELSMMQTD